MRRERCRNEGADPTCGSSADTQNHYATYGAIAHALGAELITVASDYHPGLQTHRTMAAAQPGGQWLDIGCGTGELLSVLQELGWTPRGCEADRAHVDFARHRGLDVVEGYVNELPAEVRVISALNLLEHLPSPKQWLERLTLPLARGSHVVLEVPRHPSLSSFSNLLFPGLASRHIYPPDHMHIFTEASLEHLLRACQLTARAVWVFGQDYQELMYTSAAHVGLRESAFFHRLLDASSAIQSAIDHEDLCDVLLVIAEKA